ncbi:MAG: alanine dehydrogenase, partial [Myxococcales bacterium]|nr:alanine dehydrogenase [Myxococcales bacterium]
MIVGVPREVKQDEYRVGLLPVGAELLVRDGHTVLVEVGAGEGSGFEDGRYLAAGAKMVQTPEEIWGEAELIVKVKEPQPQEISRMRKGQEVFTYFHFAADEALTLGCLERSITAIAYETLEAPGPHGRNTLPLLTPMSE